MLGSSQFKLKKTHRIHKSASRILIQQYHLLPNHEQLDQAFRIWREVNK